MKFKFSGSLAMTTLVLHKNNTVPVSKILCCSVANRPKFLPQNSKVAPEKS
jgi:hypothetical protein